VGLGQFLHQPAEGEFAVSVAHGPEGAVQARQAIGRRRHHRCSCPPHLLRACSLAFVIVLVFLV